MSKLSTQWIDVFASGKHREDEEEFTDADLDQMVSNYDPSFHEAPAVIGHPKDNGPAYGWVSALRRVGSKLQAKFKDVVPGFEAAVEAGRFKKRSVSIYKTDKGWSLRHVGFLGAQPPQIKGLADIQFEQADKDAITIEFEEEESMATDNTDAIAEGVFARIRTYFTPKPGETTATGKVYTEAEMQQLAANAATAAVTEALKPIQAKLDAHAATFSESQTAAQVADAKTRSANAVAKLKAAGKWVPWFDKAGLVSVFDELATSVKTYEYGEGDNKKTQTSLDRLVSFMETLPKLVPDGTTFTGQKPTAPARGGGQVNQGKLGVNENSAKLNEYAEDLMKKDKTLSYFDAAVRAEAEHPELALPGGMVGGTV